MNGYLWSTFCLILKLIFLPATQPITTQCRILTHLRYIAVENIVRKGEIVCNKQFLFSHNVFYLIIMALIFHFKCTLKCHLQFVSIWTSLKFCRLEMGEAFWLLLSLELFIR